jgi:mannan endo-1,4-beta-mannosidase
MHRLQTKILLCALVLGMYGSVPAQFKNFVTRDSDRLMDGDRQVRFISCNIPNLHYIEDNLEFSGTNPWRLPDEFEIRDALTAIKQMGGKVARIYVISVRRPDDAPETIRHVDAPGKFNEEAFRALDMVLQIANETGVRLIIPFVDNWKWWGGPADYAAFRGKSRDEFWTDPELISDIKSTMQFVINRKNTLTGVAYKDDKAILAWETGNELRPPFSWTREIAAYIKSLDRNHLLLEGVHFKDLSTEALEDPNLDILSTHHYGDPRVSLEAIVENARMARGKKPYIIGEYGIIPTQDLRAITDTIIHQGVTGGMVWSLRFRNRDGGFYFHHEYFSASAYHWPGFATGAPYDERLVLSMLRDKAYEIDEATPPRLPAPAPPVLIATEDVSAISWKGSVGAQSYVVERRDADSVAWQVVAANVDECRVQYRPLFNDETADIGRTYFYRVQARNESGTSDYSNCIGPVTVKVKTLVDDMESFGRVFQKDGDLSFATLQDIRKAKEDRSRLTGKEGSYIMYKIPGDAWTIKVDALCTNDNSNVSVAADSALGTMRSVPLKTRRFHFGANDYGFYDAVSYTSDHLPSGTQYVTILLHDGVHICRVEISYGSASNQLAR